MCHSSSVSRRGCEVDALDVDEVFGFQATMHAFVNVPKVHGAWYGPVCKLVVWYCPGFLTSICASLLFLICFGSGQEFGAQHPSLYPIGIVVGHQSGRRVCFGVRCCGTWSELPKFRSNVFLGQDGYQAWWYRWFVPSHWEASILWTLSWIPWRIALPGVLAQLRPSLQQGYFQNSPEFLLLLVCQPHHLLHSWNMWHNESWICERFLVWCHHWSWQEHET